MDHTNAQRQSRWRQRQKARSEAMAEELAQAHARIAALESALKQAAKAAPPESSHEEFERIKARHADLQLENISLIRALNQAEGAMKRLQAASANPKPPRKPLDPDSEAARLKAANKKLRSELATMRRWYEGEALRSGKMSLAAHRATAKCLHPDHTPSAAERENACKLFNAFRSSTL